MNISDARDVFAAIQAQPTPAEVIETQDHQDGAPALLPESVATCDEFLRGSPKAIVDSMCPTARPVIQPTIVDVPEHFDDGRSVRAGQ